MEYKQHILRELKADPKIQNIQLQINHLFVSVSL